MRQTLYMTNDKLCMHSQDCGGDQSRFEGYSRQVSVRNLVERLWRHPREGGASRLLRNDGPTVAGPEDRRQRRDREGPAQVAPRAPGLPE